MKECILFYFLQFLFFKVLINLFRAHDCTEMSRYVFFLMFHENLL